MPDALRGVELDRSAGAPPLPTQVATALRQRIAAGALASGGRAPSTRAAARALGVARGTVTAAYDQLVAEGYLVARDRSGMRVAPHLAAPHPRPAPPPRPPRAPAAAPPLDFASGSDPDRPVDDPAWRSALRAAVGPGGPALEDAIAQHLRLMRAMAVHPDDVVVTAGARAGLALLLSVVARRTGRGPRVGVESPGFPGLRRVLEALSVDTVPIPVGPDGPEIGALDAAMPLDLVLVTPNHQFPSGGALGAEGRQALIAFAERTRVLIVEDDYDSEYRHLGPPLPPLWSLAPDRVAHLGTFSAVLGRDVGTGYLIAPPSWHSDLAATRAALGSGVPPLMQRALARYLQAGGLKRRLSRARRHSAEAAALVAEAMPRLSVAPGVRSVTDSGHVLVVELAGDDADAVRLACRRAGLGVADLAAGWAGDPHLSGVLLDYGGRSPDEIRAALGVLGRALGPPTATPR